MCIRDRCCALAARLHLLPPAGARSGIAFLPLLREVWGYGLIQLSGLVSANVAGWWITALVARGDTTLLQISFFAIASQLRNLIGLFPALLTEGSFAAMATPDDSRESVPHRVMALCTYASTFVSFAIAAIAAIAAPLVLRLVYGTSFTMAALAVSVGVGVAVIQMGNAPPSARLSVVSIRSTAVINTAWALFTAAVGTVLMLHGGSAAGAMGVFMAAHVLIAAMVLIALSRRDRLPSGMVHLFLVSTSATVLLALLATYRAAHAAMSGTITGMMLLIACAAMLWLYRLGKAHHWIPSRAMLQALVERVPFLRRHFSAAEIR